ncbi:hypothetical protein [Mesorhizobium sp. Z1-4]|uniref:hypothetical protein n=1 Tax=Mesorhizobium sp. Z1-4 TaxID=2448478 RepID=UPI000FD8D492|nr:hypothetical protein [Mesorhizobium sp. Z1-4]
MAKKSKKADAGTAPRGRSRLFIAAAIALPLIVGAGGYAVWALYFAAPGNAEAAAVHDATDETKVAAVPREIMAESSFTHSHALSVLVREKCGSSQAPALREASNAEAAGDGLLAQLSWEAAARRTQLLKTKSCGYLLTEIADADARAARMLAANKSGQASKH